MINSAVTMQSVPTPSQHRPNITACWDGYKPLKVKDNLHNPSQRPNKTKKTLTRECEELSPDIFLYKKLLARKSKKKMLGRWDGLAFLSIQNK